MSQIKLRVIPKFPARVTGEAGVSVTKEGADFTIALDFLSLDEQGTVTDPASAKIVISEPGDDVETEEFFTISLANLISTLTNAIATAVLATGAAPVKLPEYSVSTAPDEEENEGCLIRVSDGDTGSECIAYSDGTDWLVVALGSAIADS